MITLCSVHHGHAHAGIVRVEGTPNAGLRFRQADGRLYGSLRDFGKPLTAA